MYDIIIVGAGVSGCYLSYLINKINKDLNVLILEKDKKVFLKDSGIVSLEFKNFFGKKAVKLIKSEINRMDYVSPSKKTFSIEMEKPFACILKRKYFSEYLRNLARKNAKIKYEVASKIEFHGNVSVFTKNNQYDCKVVIGADGANSIVRKSLGIKEPRKFIGMFERIKKSFENFDNITIFFNKHFSPEFYSWVIPQNNEYGLITATQPKDYFTYFKKSLQLTDGIFHACPIPIGLAKSFSNNAILIGDACGMTKPITGGGILFSLTACQIASDVINHAFKINNFSEKFFSRYEKRWKKIFGNEIKKQLFLRNLYKKLSNKKIDKLFERFGPNLEKIKDFDYDKIESIQRQIPKFDLIKMFFYVVLNIPII